MTNKDLIQIKSDAFNQCHEGIVLSNIDNNIITANNTACLISGYSCEELTGENPRILKSNRHGSGIRRGNNDYDSDNYPRS